MMLVGVDSGVSLWMLVKRAPRLAKMPASRSRQAAQASPKGLAQPAPRAIVVQCLVILEITSSKDNQARKRQKTEPEG